MPIVKRVIFIFIGILVFFRVDAQDIENDIQTRIGYSADIKLIKKLQVDLSPELRMDKDFYVERFLMESGLIYSPFSGFSVSGYYRFIVNRDTDEPNEYLNRFMLNLDYGIKFDRLKPYIRLRYSGFTDDVQDEKTLRYKGGVKYNLKKTKFSPNLSFELFQLLDGNILYKYRTAVGGDYKINKHNYLTASYNFEFFKTKYLNRHIFELGYKMKF